MKFYKIWKTYSWVYSGHNCSCSCISNEACAIPLPETFYFNDILQNWSTDCKSSGESRTIRLLLQPSVGGVTVSMLVSGLTVDKM